MDPAFFALLADRARYFKKDGEGRKIMSKIMEQLLDEEKIEAAKRMLERGKMTIVNLKMKLLRSIAYWNR